jgi:hypothetical protein
MQHHGTAKIMRAWGEPAYSIDFYEHRAINHREIHVKAIEYRFRSEFS